MERVTIGEVEPADFGDGVDRRRLSDPLGATGLAVVHYRIPPDEGFPSGLHAHGDQAEIFVVLDGEATFETLAPERDDADEITLTEGEAVRFAPGEYQSGRNDADCDLVALALGAPRDSDDVRIPLDCPECGHDYLRPEADEDGPLLVCPDCGTANVPGGCPDCGTEMRVTLGESDAAASDSPSEDPETLVVCPDCGTEAESPFGT
ncbi:cupin domain-containing protein [Halorussus salinisoli]|uniref:cupin domain-containing protein n=1 Tax=Halorussus salinisoli TaxID=2558242 RepID=UPI0010C1EB6C|nr:cupin domain-containing protein [Halorussus salinisoli]